jgi:hypothetical protein
MTGTVDGGRVRDRLRAASLPPAVQLLLDDLRPDMPSGEYLAIAVVITRALQRERGEVPP